MDTQQNTLAHFKSRPMVQASDFSSKRTSHVANFVRGEVEGGPDSGSDFYRHPEAEALRFYLLNHATAQVMKDYGDDMVLPEEAARMLRHYHAFLGDLGRRMFSYLILISYRETRHVQDIPSNWESILEPHSLYNHLTDMQGASSDAPLLLMQKCKIPVGEVTRMMAFTFFHGPYDNSYGGPKWGNVASTLHDFVTGKISAEVMIDTAWTLAHNTSAIFNKGMVFHSQNDYKLMQLLNAQCTGQVPELVKEAKVHNSLREFCGMQDNHTKEVLETYEIVREAMGESFFGSGFVNHGLIDREARKIAINTELDTTFGFNVPSKESDYMTGLAMKRLHKWRSNPFVVIGENESDSDEDDDDPNPDHDVFEGEPEHPAMATDILTGMFEVTREAEEKEDAKV